MGQSKIRSIFAPVKPQNEQAAVVYFIVQTQMESSRNCSSIYLSMATNSKLLHNHYYWVELPAGTYRFL
jgi:hypothetical protein